MSLWGGRRIVTKTPSFTKISLLGEWPVSLPLFSTCALRWRHNVAVKPFPDVGTWTLCFSAAGTVRKSAHLRPPTCVISVHSALEPWPGQGGKGTAPWLLPSLDPTVLPEPSFQKADGTPADLGPHRCVKLSQGRERRGLRP